MGGAGSLGLTPQRLLSDGLGDLSGSVTHLQRALKRVEDSRTRLYVEAAAKQAEHALEAGTEAKVDIGLLGLGYKDREKQSAMCSEAVVAAAGLRPPVEETRHSARGAARVNRRKRSSLESFL
eukprot:TRINITY_DN26572_c0_g1_i1.p1 TRINITY_DN26572_c0_g1~~TRINITY_DN26572_c0_g1_i1.p1  ORF type:complete len:123 (-),score=28.72 TRINITY_DN26572_c0_g1_i1:111-479(-)